MTENDLWNEIRPHLRGRWWRLESVVPDGLPDTFGLFSGGTWWLELKIGKPATKKLRPNQIKFGYDCMRNGISFYVCFGYMKKPRFYRDFCFSTEIIPPFYRPPDAA